MKLFSLECYNCPQVPLVPGCRCLWVRTAFGLLVILQGTLASEGRSGDGKESLPFTQTCGARLCGGCFESRRRIGWATVGSENCNRRLDQRGEGLVGRWFV